MHTKQRIFVVTALCGALLGAGEASADHGKGDGKGNPPAASAAPADSSGSGNVNAPASPAEIGKHDGGASQAAESKPDGSGSGKSDESGKPESGSGGKSAHGESGKSGAGGSGKSDRGATDEHQTDHPPEVAPPANSPPAPKASPSPKITICHATGNGGYVEITISENGLHGHGGHADDIIPAPAGGCPSASPAAPAPPASTLSAPPEPRKITICHATGSATNPYVEITISVNGLNGHAGHADDIIPAPAGGCPAGQPASPAPASTPATTVAGGTAQSSPPAATAPSSPPAATAGSTPAASPAPVSAATPPATSGVQSVTTTRTKPKPKPHRGPRARPTAAPFVPPASRFRPPAPAARSGLLHIVAATSLPFTGLPLLPFVVAGIALVGGGLVFRRMSARQD